MAAAAYENDLNLKATELRLGLPGTQEIEKQLSPKIGTKRPSLEMDNSSDEKHVQQDSSPAPTAQIIGWPPVRSYRKNVVQAKKLESDVSSCGMYVKVSMDGAPYLRKIDLRVYKSYQELLKALDIMFKNGVYSDYAPTYEDKEGDWMLVGDVPWDMFINSCRRLRIMKGSEAKGLECP